MTDTRTPVVFIHRLWLHTASWAPWLDLFRTSGYERLPLAALRSTLPVFKNPANKHKVVSLTAVIEFPDRGYPLTVDTGWPEAADGCLA